jgi:hypothetical protein
MLKHPFGFTQRPSSISKPSAQVSHFENGSGSKGYLQTLQISASEHVMQFFIATEH